MKISENNPNFMRLAKKKKKKKKLGLIVCSLLYTEIALPTSECTRDSEPERHFISQNQSYLPIIVLIRLKYC